LEYVDRISVSQDFMICFIIAKGSQRARTLYRQILKIRLLFINKTFIFSYLAITRTKIAVFYLT